MSIRCKLISFFIIQHTMFLLIAFLLSEFLVRPHNLDVEQKNAEAKITQIKNTLISEMQHLNLSNTDWSIWDDTYAFVQNRNESYIESNFEDDALESINLNYMGIFDLSGKNIFERHDENIDISSLFSAPNVLDKKLIKWTGDERFKGKYGIMSLKDKIVFVSITPVLKGDKTGFANGSFMMIREIGEEMIQKINKSADVNISLISVDEALFTESDKDGKLQTNVLNDGELEVKAYLEGFGGSSPVAINIILKRDFIIESEKLVSYLYILGGSLGLLSFLISFYLLRREVLTPLTGLGEHIGIICENDSLIPSDMDNRKDEIGLLAREFNILIEQIKSKNEMLAKVARIDALTGLSNRLDLEERFETERRHSCRKQKAFSILLLDIDYFKKYNDTYGHIKGDAVLSMVAKAIKESAMRPHDYTARYGGEEFIVILPESQESDAAIVAKRILENVESLRIEHRSSLLEKKMISVSIGCVTLVANKEQTQEFIINMADEALYSAKAKGRDGYAVYEPTASDKV